MFVKFVCGVRGKSELLYEEVQAIKGTSSYVYC
jgi:hypothetical protein